MMTVQTVSVSCDLPARLLCKTSYSSMGFIGEGFVNNMERLFQQIKAVMLQPFPYNR